MKKLTLLIFTVLFLGIGSGKAQYTVMHNFGSFANDGDYPYGSLTISGKVLYGVTRYGGAFGYGTIFAIDTNGSRYRDLHNFDSIHGSEPFYDSLIYVSGKLYGMTSSGGLNNTGCIFSIDTDGSNYNDFFDFNGPNGAYPYGSLTLSGGKLYGMTFYGGADSNGCIFSIDTNGIGYSDLHDFNGTDGALPLGSLTLSGKVLYGITFKGGINNEGCIFSMDTNGSNYNDLFVFDSISINHHADLTLSGKLLYCMNYVTGSPGYIFLIDTNGNGYRVLLNFNLTNGSCPLGSLLLSGNTLYAMSSGGPVSSGDLYYGLIFSMDINGNGYKTMFDFNGTNGYNPQGSLTLSGNVLYGMTTYGGTNNAGVIFKIDTDAVAFINNLTDIKAAINVYPSPSNGIFTISLGHAELVSESQTIEIYDVLGEKIYNEMLKQVQHDYEINISNQPNGVYLFRVIAESGELIGDGKVVVEH